MEKFSSEYWNKRYLSDQTNWDIGYASPAIVEFIEKLGDKNLRVLVPGAGNGYEVEYLFHNGFHNAYLLDFSEQSILNFLSRCPDFPTHRIIHEDFFDVGGQFDLILEQTFFSSIPPHKRHMYAMKMHGLLKDNGILAGLLWSHAFDFEGPPFGGSRTEYEQLFTPFFKIETMEIANNSIKPRRGRELFIKLRKKNP